MNLFEQLGLKDQILKAIVDLGFETPTPIQEKTIPAILESKGDIIALAQTGTGKTAAFGLPVLQQINIANNAVQALVLCPTRELCLQITNDIKNFSKHMRGLKVEAIYGGASIVPQLKALRSGVHIVVGTPGRTLDVINRDALKVDNIQWLVLDEADEMLQMGFKDELDAILATTPKEKQTLLFSATMPQGVRHIAANYMNKPEEISVGKKNQGADTVEHHLYTVKAHDRYQALKRLADINPEIYGIVFCRTRQETKEIADKLIQDKYNADSLHGDLSQAQRDAVMQRFRNKNLQLLVATDVAARGLDVNELTHVINYNLPDDPEVYVHRSGRTGRAGRSGISILITHSRDGRKVKDLEKLMNKKFVQKSVPGGREICEKRLFSVIDNIEKVNVDYKQIESFMPVIFEKLAHMDRDEIIRRFVSVEFNHFLEYYRNATDLNVQPDKAGRTRDYDSDRGRDYESSRSRDFEDRPSRNRDFESDGPRKRSSRGGNFSRFYINIGSKHQINPGSLIGMINDKTQNREIEIGKIEILRKFSFFEVDSAFENQIAGAFNGMTIENEPVVVQLSKPAEYDSSERRGGSSDRRSSGERSYGDRSYSDRGSNDRSSNDRSSNDRRSNSGDRKSSDRSGGERSYNFEKPTAGRKEYGRPSKPSFDKDKGKPRKRTTKPERY